MIVRDGTRGDDHLGPVGAQDVTLLLAHLIGHSEDAAVALDGRGDREAHPSVAAGGFDDGAPRLEQSARLGILQHAQGRTILDRLPRIEKLDLGQDQARHSLSDPVQLNQRCMTDRLQQVFRVLHGFLQAPLGPRGNAFVPVMTSIPVDRRVLNEAIFL